MGPKGLEQTGDLPLGEIVTLLDPKENKGRHPSQKLYSSISASSEAVGWVKKENLARGAAPAVIYGDNLTFIRRKASFIPTQILMVVAILPGSYGDFGAFCYYDAEAGIRYDGCELQSGDISVNPNEVEAGILLQSAARVGDEGKKRDLILSAQSAYPHSAVCEFMSRIYTPSPKPEDVSANSGGGLAIRDRQWTATVSVSRTPMRDEPYESTYPAASCEACCL